MLVRVMSSASMNSINMVNYVGIFNVSVAMNKFFNELGCVLYTTPES